jgi:hypothetical protein
LDKDLKTFIGLCDLGIGTELEPAPVSTAPPPPPVAEVKHPMTGSNGDLAYLFDDIKPNEQPTPKPETKIEPKPEQKPEIKAEDKKDIDDTRKNLKSQVVDMHDLTFDDDLDDKNLKKNAEKPEKTLDSGKSDAIITKSTSENKPEKGQNQGLGTSGTELGNGRKGNGQLAEPSATSDPLLACLNAKFKELSGSNSPYLPLIQRMLSYYETMRDVLIHPDYPALLKELENYYVDVSGLRTPEQLSEALQRIQAFKGRVSHISCMVMRDYIPKDRMYDMFEKTALKYITEGTADKRKAEVAELLSDIHAHLSKAEVLYKTVHEISSNLESSFNVVSREITIFQEKNRGDFGRGSLPFDPTKNDPAKAEYIKKSCGGEKPGFVQSWDSIK